MSTIKDVAKRAGVSTATVSHVINGTKKLTEDTRDRVLAAIAELNYHPSHTAKSFKSGRRNAVAFIIPDISNNYFANVTDALETALGKAGYTLILANTRGSLAEEKKQLSFFTSDIVDGIVLASSAERWEDIRSLIPENFPVLLLDRSIRESPLDLVGVADREAVLEGMGRLLADGHTKIGYIGDEPHISTARERLQAYHEFMELHDLEVRPEWIRHTTSLTHDTYKITGELLAAGCTALFIASNLMTVDACCYLVNHGLEASGIKILGYQHKDLHALFRPYCYLIGQREREMGQAAGENILHRIAEPELSRREIMLSNEFLSSPSTDPAGAASLR